MRIDLPQLLQKKSLRQPALQWALIMLASITVLTETVGYFRSDTHKIPSTVQTNFVAASGTKLSTIPSENSVSTTADISTGKQSNFSGSQVQNLQEDSVAFSAWKSVLNSIQPWISQSNSVVFSSGVTTQNDAEFLLKISLMQRDFSSSNLFIYDGRSVKNHAADVRKWLNLHFWITVAGINTVGVYDTTFLAGTSAGEKRISKWFPWIYTGSVSLPSGVTAIVIGDNWEKVLPKLVREVFY